MTRNDIIQSYIDHLIDSNVKLFGKEKGIKTYFISYLEVLYDGGFITKSQLNTRKLSNEEAAKIHIIWRLAH